MDGFEDSDQEDFDQVGSAVDMISSSSKGTRQSGLNLLRKYLLSNYDIEVIGKYEISLNNMLFNCLKTGKVEERCVAADVLALLVFHSGESDFSDEIFDKFDRYANRILSDTRKDDYSELIRAVAIVHFVASDNPSITQTFMNLLLTLASNKNNESQAASALQAWTFLFLTIPLCEYGGSEDIEAALQVMKEHLFENNSAIRSAAGEAIAVIISHCNLVFGGPVDSSNQISPGLELILTRMKEIEKNLGEDMRKSKKNRAEQRSEFKEYLKIIEGESPKKQKISLPTGQSIIVDGLPELVALNMIRGFLGDGFQYHVLNNPIMHHLLGFEPVDFQVERGDSAVKRGKLKARKEQQRLSSAFKCSMIL